MRTNRIEFREKVITWARRIDVSVDEIHVRPMKNKWGSLSTNGRLSFNAELLGMEERLQEYVIVHELLHLRVPNHGKLFKSLLYAFVPDWENLEEKMKIDE